MRRTYKEIVQQGTKRATELGFPTVNIPLGDRAVSGIYAARVRIGGNEYQAAAYADQRRKVLEAHLLDQHRELYGSEVEIDLLEKIRGDKVFETDDALHVAIADDIEKVRRYFKRSL